jgi:hypothetical protein
LSELELLFLRRLVHTNIENLNRKMTKLNRNRPNHPDIYDYDRELSLTQSELDSMRSVLGMIDRDIAVMEVIATFREV